jgi:N-hydroxyarylamine O-acetyltransferase
MDAGTTPVDAGLRDAYLARLGWDDVPEPSLDTLFALHRAQVARVPYESVWIALGERRKIDPLSSMRYLTSGDGAGGYCYHLNGAFSLLLEWLGFQVRRHLGGVQPHPSAANPSPAPGANGNHLAVTVVGFPDPRSPDGGWLIDAGLGDGLYEPLPLITGTYDQGPFHYGLRPSEVNAGGWRFDHDARLSFVGFDYRSGPVAIEEFEERHRFLMTSPDSGYVRVVTAQRREANGIDTLRGRVLSRLGDDDGREHVVADRSEWQSVLGDMFGISLAGVEHDTIDGVWSRVCAAHEAFLAAGG